METKFTPGPWRLTMEDGRHPIVQRGTEGGFQVCGMSDEKEDADAHLIAAAPDLYEALSEMVRVYWADGDGIDPPPACITQALAALSLARSP